MLLAQTVLDLWENYHFCQKGQIFANLASTEKVALNWVFMDQSILFLYTTQLNNINWHQRKDEKTLSKIDDLNFIQIWEKWSEFWPTPFPYPSKFEACLPNLKRFFVALQNLRYAISDYKYWKNRFDQDWGGICPHDLR